MYHIGKDKRQIDSAEKIRLSLSMCLKVKAMSEISVSDISEASGVSRSTFYRSFDSPVDVLMYASDRRVEEVVKDFILAPINGREEFVLFALRYLDKRSDLLEAVVNCDRLDIVQKSIECNSDHLVGVLRDGIKNEFTERELEYVLAGITGLLTSLLQVWIKGGKKESPEQLYELYRKIYRLERQPLPTIQV